MNRRTLLLISTGFLAIFTIFGMVNAASASLPAGSTGTTALSVNTNSDPFDIASFNCADIQTHHIDMQTNLRANAIMQKCGSAAKSNASTGFASTGNSVIDSLLSPLYGGTDVNVHPPTSPSIQSESFSWQHSTHVVVAYNDLGTCTGGGSLSTDGGATFAFYTPNPFCTGHGTNFGDPAVVYSARYNKWVVQFLASGCGGQGLGTWVSTDDGATFASGPCAANASSGSGDRNSSWVDNNPSSPYYGNIYASYNDFSVGGGALRVVRSTDGGVTWLSPVNVFASFRRDVQISGDTGSSGYVYLASMDEGGGGASNRTNYIYRSTDGGATWNAGVTTGAAYAPPGAAACSGNSYFYTITPQIRHMGWGQPAGGPNNTVHYVYARHGTGADEGDIYYVRSTDSGLTWSTPLKLNQDAGLRAQWMPSIGVTASGAVFVKWYDRRNTSNNDYEIYGRASLDNGVNWQADAAVSDAVIPQPIVQVANCYMGDYDYWSADGNTVQGSWTDSRGSGSGGTQDVFHDGIPLSVGTPTPTGTSTSTNTPTRTRTSTSTSTPTITNTPVVSNTPTNTSTPTATDTPVPTDTSEATSTPTICPIQFTDVLVGSTFYDYVRCLACRGIINGYPDGTFRPNNNVTRGQLSKIVSNSAGFNDPQTTQMFQDVPVGSTFFDYIGRLASRGYIGGYACGGSGEPCQPGNLPYFRPNNNATRGQITKINSNAAGYNDDPSGQQFEDIAVGSTFYTYTYRLVTRSIMSGYPCGSPGEPCQPGNLPYFRPNNNATRGQTSKIVANTFFPNCQTPLDIKR